MSVREKERGRKKKKKKDGRRKCLPDVEYNYNKIRREEEN